MAEHPVVDASVLIVLSKSGLLPILRLAGEVVIVPRVVAGEINALGPEDVTARAVSAASWLVVVDTPPIPSVIGRCRLDDGEAAVLAWAMSHPGAAAIVDDRTARRCGLELGIPIRGTVNLVLAAKQARVIPLARPILNRLRGFGLYLSDRIMNDALTLVGE